MHELAITQGIVDLVAERTTGRQVVSVRVRVGDRSGVFADAMRFSWDLATTTTALEGATLTLDEVPGTDLLVTAVELVREPTCA